MEWVWLLVSLLGLGALWLLIRSIEKLVTNIKNHDDERRIASQALAERIAGEEENFERKQAAKEFLLTPRSPRADGQVPPEFKEAMSVLNSAELLETMVAKVFGDPKDTEMITAEQSAFAQPVTTKAVAKGNGVLPVKTKTATDKTGLSKAEQKMLKKIKRES